MSAEFVAGFDLIIIIPTRYLLLKLITNLFIEVPNRLDTKNALPDLLICPSQVI
ncbi:MAG: hypothetical protein CM15mP58_15990 [Burkholderiaceae bacterium]|nr:MAG: hypothetical protein CM15mP58_15990 [Burkholderiaceae bacterium]